MASDLPEWLTLDEAAQFIGGTLGSPWTQRMVIDRAARGELSIFARIQSAVRLVRVGGCEPGEPSEILAPAGSLPRISAKAATALLLGDSAPFEEITYPRAVDFFGVTETVTATVWVCAPGEAAPRFDLNACRVSREGCEQFVVRRTADIRKAVA